MTDILVAALPQIREEAKRGDVTTLLEITERMGRGERCCPGVWLEELCKEQVQTLRHHNCPKDEFLYSECVFWAECEFWTLSPWAYTIALVRMENIILALDAVGWNFSSLRWALEMLGHTLLRAEGLVEEVLRFLDDLPPKSPKDTCSLASQRLSSMRDNAWEEETWWMQNRGLGHAQLATS